MDFTKHTTSRKVTPQTKKVPGVKKQTKNSAGGVSFKISKWEFFKRFLILGTEGGTHYISEKNLTIAAAEKTQKCIDADGKMAVDMIVDVSKSGRAANNDAAIFALAMAASCDNEDTRKYALSKLSEVCRIGTHMFHFINFIKSGKMRGFGRSLREAISNWYTSKNVNDLAYQMLKYQSRDGWSHRDTLRLCHAQPTNKSMSDLFAYAVGKSREIPNVSPYAEGMRKVKDIATVSGAAEIIREYRLTREVIPTHLLNEVAVWEALLEGMPMTALVRNLGKMASIGMHKPFSISLNTTLEKLTDPVAIEKSRLHPLTILNALAVYSTGSGIKGSLKWEASAKVSQALEDAFYISFGNVEVSGKNVMLALDVSGSMTGPKIPGGVLDCREASGCMALVTMKVEPNHFITGFTEGGKRPFGSRSGGYSNRAISELNISVRNGIRSCIKSISDLPFSGTDCALPMLYCIHNNIDADTIVIYTDNETWAGQIHPWQALDQMQQKFGHEVRLAVVGMVSTGFSIARPDYTNMMDFVGFDTNTPNAIGEFFKM